MKHVVFWLLLVLLAGNSVGLSQTYSVEFAYLDLSSGPLCVEPGRQLPIEDGALCQIIEDFERDGIDPPSPDGSPGHGDRLLILNTKNNLELARKDRVDFNTFHLNGQQLFGSAGYFLISPGISGSIHNTAPIYVRVWCHSNPQQATAYWDTPLYRMISGRQQMSFSKNQLSFHEFTSAQSENGTLGLPSPPPSLMSAIIRDYALHDAYPNPFNPSTTIAIDLPEAAMVDLRIFDLMGREVRHLLHEIHPAGQMQVMFDGANLPSGLYIAAAKLGDKFMATKKITLLK